MSQFRANCTSFSFWRTNDLVEILSASDLLPLRHVLKELFDRCHISEEFQLEDVSAIANALIFRSVPLEELGAIQDIVVTNSFVGNDPMRGRPSAWTAYLCKLMALGLDALGQDDSLDRNVYLASCAPQTGSSAAVEIGFTIDLTEYRDGSIQEVKRSIRAQVENVQTAETLMHALDLVTLLSGGGSAESFLDACVIQAGIESDDLWRTIAESRQRLSVGRAFLASARDFGFLHTPKKVSRLLRACSDLLHDRNLVDGHWLREGLGANEPQRARGDWKAWRHDIDDEFHLHYWRSGANVELANVVVHNDFGITR